MTKRIFLSGLMCATTSVFAVAQTTQQPDTTSTLDKGIILRELQVGAQAMNRSGLKSLDMGMLRLDNEQLMKLPTMLGEPDIIKALTFQPGVSEGVEGFSGLYVRGGGNDQNLILLDGVPLYQISHLGGLFSSFNPQIVNDVTFYKASFPAQYGGRLSSVVDIRTKQSNLQEYHGALSLGLTSGMARITGPIVKGKTGFDISVRRSWLDALSAPALAIINRTKKSKGEKTIGRYAFTDLNARIDHRFSAKNRISLSAYWGNDVFKYGSENFSQPDDSYHLEHNEDRLRWGNALVAASWKYDYSRIAQDITVSYTRYKSIYDRESIANDESDKNESKRKDKNQADDIMATANWSYPINNGELKFGGFFTHHRFRPSYVNFSQTRNGETQNKTFSDYLIKANETGAYADFAWNPIRWLGLSAGMRFAAFNIYDNWFSSIEPRALFNFKILPRLSWKLSYTRMGQFVQQVSDSYVNLPTDLWMPMGKDTKPLRSDQIATGVYFDWNYGLSFSAEGYHKWMKGVAEPNEDYSYSYDKMQNIDYGKGRAYGIDLTIAKNTGKITGSIGYGLMWNKRQIEGINGGRWYPAKFDNRHKINIIANYRINKKIELTGSWVFATGNRMTVPVYSYQDFLDAGFPTINAPHIEPGYGNENLGIQYIPERNNVRLPAYHRLDLGASFTKQLKNGRKGVWHVGLYNAYCHMNAMVIKRKEQVYMQQNGMVSTTGTNPWNISYEKFSLFPIIPNVSYTYYF